jgi:UDP-3-O-[3-hydroxymyristoyl] glucosamine N-acyltransferase
MKLREIADRLGCRLEGDGELEIAGVAGLENAGPEHLTFIDIKMFV